MIRCSVGKEQKQSKFVVAPKNAAVHCVQIYTEKESPKVVKFPNYGWTPEHSLVSEFQMGSSLVSKTSKTFKDMPEIESSQAFSEILINYRNIMELVKLGKPVPLI